VKPVRLGVPTVVQAAAAVGCSVDADLVRRCLSGQREAFDELVHRYQQRAISVSQGLLGDLHDAFEVCQNAFLRAYLHLATLDEPARFGPWLLRIVSNLSLNHRRDRAVGGRRVSIDGCADGDGTALVDVLELPTFRDEQPGAKLRADELSTWFDGALSKLSDQQRTALVLFSIDEMPQREVARVLGCSVEAVKWHVFQARKKLRAGLALCSGEFDS